MPALELDPGRCVEGSSWGEHPPALARAGDGLVGLWCRLSEGGFALLGGSDPQIFACSFVAVTMFWKFDLNTTSHVDKLLDKEDVTLRELLDEDDVLQECKAQNQKLLGFLCWQQCMEELVSLITQDPPLDMEEKVRFKYVPRL